MKKTLKQTGYIKGFDNTRIYFEVRGEGKPLIFTYGIGCVMNHWQYQIKHFSNHYQVVCFDYRAHHQSEVPRDKGNMTVDALAQDLLALIDHLDIKQAGFWGHSFGAQMLIRSYDLFAQRFSHLVLVNGFASNPLSGMFGNNLASSFFELFRAGYLQLPETFKYLWKFSVNNSLAVQLSALAGGFNLQVASLKDIEIYARGLTTMDLDCFIRLFEDMMRYDGRPVLDRINVPTLIVSGKKDSVTPLTHQQEFHRRIKGSQLLNVPYGSHCTQLDFPDYLNLSLDKFLQNPWGKSPNTSDSLP